MLVFPITSVLHWFCACSNTLLALRIELYCRLIPVKSWNCNEWFALPIMFIVILIATV